MEILYTLFILPIELLMDWILKFAYAYTNSYGFSIILLSVAINILVIPLNYLADKWALREKILQKTMQYELDVINSAFKGQERYMMLRTMYRQYEYHPIYALRASFGLLLQIPFFIAAYQLLSAYPDFDNVGFLFLKNLSVPDALLSLGSLHINILPIIMTCISLITAHVYNKNATKSEQMQSYGLALLFLILLYISPAGLVLYWTLNNIAYLLRNILKSKQNEEITPSYNSRTFNEAYPSRNLWKRVAKPLGSIALTVPLGWMCCHIFMWSNNSHMFTNKALFISFIFITFVAILFWGFGKLWLKLFHKVFARHMKSVNAINTILFAGAFSLIIGIFLMEPVLNPIPVKLPLVLFFICMCFIFYYAKTTLNTLLCVMLVFVLFNFASSVMQHNIPYIKDTSTAPVEVNLVTLKKKPNIYLFWLESYHDFETQRKIYGINTKPIQDLLAKNNFITYDHVYADGSATLFAFTEVYGMGNFLSKTAGISDTTAPTRMLIGGSDDNLLLKNLKHNKYHTTKILGSKYSPTMISGAVAAMYVISFDKKYPYLDQTDYDGLFAIPFTFLLPCYNFIATTIKFQFLEALNTLGSQHLITGTLAERVNTVMKTGLQKHEPFFIAFKGGAEHVGGTYYTYDDANKWIQSKDYNKFVNEGNEEIKEIINNIVINDPNSMVILISDHGAWRFLKADAGAKNIGELRENLKKVNISYKDFINDRFGGMLAIRFPNGEKVDITGGHYMSQRNLFTHIFAYLSDDLSYLEQRKESRSKFGNMILTRNGKILYE